MDSSSSIFSSDRARDAATTLVVALVLAAGHWIFSVPERAAPGLPKRRPFGRIVYSTDPEFIAGVSERAEVMSNEQGLRGQLLSAQTYNVLLIGGSTTYCILLDEGDSLVGRLAQRLGGRRVGGRPVRVASSARGGYTASLLGASLRHTASQPDTPPSLIVVMPGANDVEAFFTGLPWPRDTPTPWIPRDSPFALAQWDETYAGWYLPGSQGQYAPRVRRAYTASRRVRALDAYQQSRLERAVHEFERELSALARQAARHGAAAVFVTQPINYGGSDVDDRVRSWMPYFVRRDRVGFIPAPSLVAALMARFNEVTRDVARRRGLVSIDLAETLGDCGACFYDQWHFTVAGAQRAARSVAPVVESLLEPGLTEAPIG